MAKRAYTPEEIGRLMRIGVVFDGNGNLVPLEIGSYNLGEKQEQELLSLGLKYDIKTRTFMELEYNDIDLIDIQERETTARTQINAKAITDDLRSKRNLEAKNYKVDEEQKTERLRDNKLSRIAIAEQVTLQEQAKVAQEEQKTKQTQILKDQATFDATKRAEVQKHKNDQITGLKRETLTNNAKIEVAKINREIQSDKNSTEKSKTRWKISAIIAALVVSLWALGDSKEDIKNYLSEKLGVKKEIELAIQNTNVEREKTKQAEANKPEYNFNLGGSTAPGSDYIPSSRGTERD